MAVVYLYRDNGKLRDAHAEAIDEMNKTFTGKLEAIAAASEKRALDAAAAMAAQIDKIASNHASALQTQVDRYERQVAEMHQRTFTIVGTLTDKLSALADSITRSRGARG